MIKMFQQEMISLKQLNHGDILCVVTGAFSASAVTGTAVAELAAVWICCNLVLHTILETFGTETTNLGLQLRP